MLLDKAKLFENTKALWPDIINPSGMVIGGNKYKGSDILNAIYWQLENTFGVNDHWKQLSIWAFHQAIPEEYSDLLDRGYSIRPRDVKFEDFAKKMRETLLGDDAWEKERSIYFGTGL